MTTRTDLAALLSPTSLEGFIDGHWSKAPLLVRGPAQDRFDGLFDLARFEFLATSVTVPGWLSIVSEGQIKPPAREQMTLDLTPNIAAIARAVAEKKSLLLLNINRLDAGVGVFCRGIADDMRKAGLVLGKPVRANAYYTPPRAQGLDPHYDDHDVLVLQLHGAKRWRLHGEAVKWPRKPMTETLPPQLVNPKPTEVTLAAGDVLYLPRGQVHEAAAQETASLHLTLSLHAATWGDVLARLVEQDEALGAPLPVGFCRGATPRAEDMAALAAIAGGLAQGPGVNRALAEIVNRTFLDGDLPANGQLARLETGVTLAPDTMLVLAEGVAAQLEREGEVPLLRVPGAAYRADPRAAPFFAAVCAAAPFRLSDLYGAPDLPAVTELARQLVLRGILVAAAAPK